jgi:transcriptional/translational regulatory protein YebC/TACO1
MAPDSVEDPEEMEFELIDFGLEKLEVDEEEAVIYTDYQNFGKMAKALEEKGIETTKAQLERVPTSFAELNEEQTDQILELIDKFEEDDDVQAVYHNLK